MKDICKKFSKNRANAHKTQQKLLEKELDFLLSFPSTEETTKQISEIHEKLGTIHWQRVAGVKLQSKDHFYNENEKPTKYFFGLENIRRSQKNITKLTDNDGKVLTDKDQILNHIAGLYTKLYTEEPTDTQAQQKLLDSIHRRLPIEVGSVLDGELDLEECYEALSKMSTQKSPGTDELPAEFYVLFWDTLGRNLVEVLNFGNSQNLLVKSMCSAILTLAFKGKDNANKNDRLFLKNWRPISLLNVDYKIGAKALANRLQKVLHYVISPDQTCNVPGRSILGNLYFDNKRLL